MIGMSERQYASHAGLSRGAIQKAKESGRLVLLPDGSIDAAASDPRRAATTDPSKTRTSPKPTAAKLKPVPEAAVAAVGETLREEGLPTPIGSCKRTWLEAGQGACYRRAKWAQELLVRAGHNKTLVAIANKTARMAWAVLRSGESYKAA